jgi:hypothetical protein
MPALPCSPCGEKKIEIDMHRRYCRSASEMPVMTRTAMKRHPFSAAVVPKLQRHVELWQSHVAIM